MFFCFQIAATDTYWSLKITLHGQLEDCVFPSLIARIKFNEGAFSAIALQCWIFRRL